LIHYAKKSKGEGQTQGGQTKLKERQMLALPLPPGRNPAAALEQAIIVKYSRHSEVVALANICSNKQPKFDHSFHNE